MGLPSYQCYTLRIESFLYSWFSSFWLLVLVICLAASHLVRFLIINNWSRPRFFPLAGYFLEVFIFFTKMLAELGHSFFYLLCNAFFMPSIEVLKPSPIKNTARFLA